MKTSKAYLISLLTVAMALMAAAIAFAEDAAGGPATSTAIPTILQKGGGVEGEHLGAAQAVTDFYKARNFFPAWVDDDRPTAQAKELIKYIGGIDADGLDPKMYHQPKIDELLAEYPDAKEKRRPEIMPAVDMLLTDAFFLIASNLSAGILEPFSSGYYAYKQKNDIDLPGVLNGAIQGSGIGRALDALKPTSPMYTTLKSELARYKAIAANGGWPAVGKLEGKVEKIEPGGTSPVIPAIRKYLEVSEGLPATTPQNPELYSDDLVAAVKKFQLENGFNDDGVIGKLTLEVMNTPVTDRICQIKINMDRLRALAKSFSINKFIVVNIPAFELDVFENGQSVLNMRTIVGRYSDKSPRMTDIVEYIVFSPKWHVPTKIALKEELGKLKEDPEKFHRRGMRVYKGEGRDRVEVDVTSTDWSGISADNFEYKFVQDPGSGNALGGIKFLFPNDDDVYMHDTPTKPLFAKDVRAFSHGCIRIEKPVEMAEYLLKGTDKWDRDKIIAASKRGSELMVTLQEKVPIYIVYLTAWGENGRAQFRRDFYNYDAKLKSLFCSN
jgi:murein L,D-transpeptidase YcbB/YkuD